MDVAGLLDVLLDEFLAVGLRGLRRRGGGAWTPPLYRVQLLERGERDEPLLVGTEDGPLPVDGGGAGAGGAVSESVRCDAGVRTQHAPGARTPEAGVHGAHAPGPHAHALTPTITARAT